MEKVFKNVLSLLVFTSLFGFLVTPAMGVGFPIWTEDFEGNWQDCWYVENGTWEVGPPTSGPGVAHSGTNSAATILDGDYGNYVSARIIRNCAFVVPPASQNPVLRFSHYYYFTINDSDYGRVQIRAVGDTNWTTLTTYGNHGGGIWSRPLISLSDYAGQNVEIAFQFSSDNGYVEPGWYIDDVSLEVGQRFFTDPENWESGLDDWYVESGTWDIGTPTSGPGNAHGGVNCVATGLDGDYSNYTASRLISPPLSVPSADQLPVLRFWHYYYFTINDSDYGQVQIRVVGDTDWATLTTYRNHGGGIWSRPLISLMDYAGQDVEISFYFSSDNGYVEPGWYIDDVGLEVGPRSFTSPEDWESGLGDWYVESGTWDIGAPTGDGPSSVHSGDTCVATRLDGDYSNYVSSRLISPPFFICPSVSNPVLRFWHWYYFTISDNDYGRVDIRIVGETDWNPLETYYNHSGGLWTQPYIPLSDYIGQTVEISFYFHSDNGYTEPGWYIDDIELQGLAPFISYTPLAKYGLLSCPVLISTKVDDPCGEELSYHWGVPENCTLIGAGPEVEVECSVVNIDPYPVSLSVVSDTSSIGPPEKSIYIFTQVAHDSDADEDLDGSDLSQFANAFVPDDLARFAMEYGLVACDQEPPSLLR